MEKCSQCGWIHPPVVGECPAAKLKAMSESKKGKTITAFVKQITDILYASEEWESQIRSIKAILNIK